MGLIPKWQQTRDGRFWYCGEPSPNREFRMERWVWRLAMLVPLSFFSIFILPRPWHFIGLAGWAIFTGAFIGRQIYFKWNMPWADWRVRMSVRQADGTVAPRVVIARGIDTKEAYLRARYQVRQGGEDPLETEVLGLAEQEPPAEPEVAEEKDTARAELRLAAMNFELVWQQMEQSSAALDVLVESALKAAGDSVQAYQELVDALPKHYRGRRRVYQAILEVEARLTPAP